MQSALAGINIAPCTEHPCSSGYVFTDHNLNVDFPEMSINSLGIPPCGEHGTCKPHLDDFTCECPLYSSGDKCQYQLPLLDMNRKPAIPGFTGDSFLHFEDEEIASDGSDIEGRDDVGYESEEDHETAEEKKLRLARIYLQVCPIFYMSNS